MKKIDYFPNREGDRINWLENLKSKIAGYKEMLGLTDDEVAKIIERCNADISSIKKQLDLKAQMQKQSKEKDSYLKASEKILRKIISRLKTHSNYTGGIGEDLRVYGDEQVIDPKQLKPVISGVQIPLGVEVNWFKGPADAINIYVDRGDNKGFVFLATDIKPSYIDTFNIQNFIDAQAKLRTKGEPIPGAEITLEQEPKVKSVVWQYYAIYVINDKEVGKPSETISVTVTVK